MFAYLVIGLEIAILYTAFWYVFVREVKPYRVVGNPWGGYGTDDFDNVESWADETSELGVGQISVNQAMSNQAASNLAASNQAVSNQAVSNQAVSNEVVSNQALTQNALMKQRSTKQYAPSQSMIAASQDLCINRSRVQFRRGTPPRYSDLPKIDRNPAVNYGWDLDENQPPHVLPPFLLEFRNLLSQFRVFKLS